MIEPPAGPGPGAVATARTLRRDAARNRDRIRRVAVEVFSEHGLEVGVEDIAHQAGVGMGTLYRRFPTKERLIEELVADLLDSLLAAAVESLEVADGGGLETFLRRNVEVQASHRGFLPRLWATPLSHDLTRRFHTVIAELVADGQAQGALRDDLTIADVIIVIWSMRGVIETAAGVAPGVCDRHLDLIMAGLRPGAAGLAHPSLDVGQLDAMDAARRSRLALN